jgi:Asp-tRNA(Asn)/Glu-tRNA(Gln) amidotransferase A subunit family amidase
MQDALWKMPAAAQAEAVRSAEISGVELVDSHLDRIGEVNPKVNPDVALRSRPAEGGFKRPSISACPDAESAAGGRS